MTLSTISAPWQNVSMPALDLRRFLSAGFQEGVGSSTDMTVAQRAAGANFSVDISSGEAVVLGETITKQGLYYAYNDATFNLTGFTAAHATLPRVDRVALRVRDSFHGDAASDLAFVIVTGTATAGATLANLTGAAAVPAGHLLLANVLIPATATTVTTANIATTYQTVRPSWTPTVVTTTTTTSLMSGGPPGSPSDKDIWYATNVDGNGARWGFQYNAGSGSAFKWEFIGGSPMRSEVDSQETTTSTAYTDLATTGPSVTLPRAGDYIVRFGGLLGNSTTTNPVYITPKRGGAAASDLDAVHFDAPPTLTSVSMQRERPLTGMAAADVVKLQYRVVGGTGAFGSRFLFVTPIRIS